MSENTLILEECLHATKRCSASFTNVTISHSLDAS